MQENQKEDIEEMMNLIESKKKKQTQTKPVKKNNQQVKQKIEEKNSAKKKEAIGEKLKEKVKEMNKKKEAEKQQAFAEEKVPKTSLQKTVPADLEKTEREKEIEKMIGFLKKDEEDFLKKDRLTEKVNKLVEETEKDLGKITYTGRPEKKEKKSESFFSKLKKGLKKN